MTDKKQKTKAKHSGSENRQRQARITVRCTAAQRAMIDEAASRAGLSVSAYFLAATLNAEPPHAARVPPLEMQVLGQLSAQLGRINGNLYQIVRAINFRDFPDLRDWEDTPAAIYQMREEVLKAIGKRPADEPAAPEPLKFKTPEEARIEFADRLRGFAE